MGFDQLMTTFELAPKEEAVFVGFLRSSGVHKNGEGMTVAQIGAIHEFGSQDGRIPERSFMRSSVDASGSELERIIEKLVGKITDGKMQTTQALGVVGEFVKGKMISRINSGIPPANAPATIARKGSSQPLIDTGQMKNSIEWQVGKGKGSS
jgi:hypothetical protein